ncbi:MAG TPA: L,D-transpeptidase [Acidimicrobiia bacterium]|nr:L,D-transpeptidase [Acidimicrobiia bacterium]
MFVRALVTILVALMLAACGTDTTATTTAPLDPAATSTLPPTSTTTSSTSTTSTAPPETTTITDPVVETTAPTPPPGGDELAQATAVFETWVGHLAAGNHQEAWDAMAPTSQAAVGEDLFFDSMVFPMAEGWGSWSASEDVTYRLEQDENGRTLLWVSGTIQPEGMTEYREVAVPMVETEDGYLVSPFEEFGNVAEGVEEELEGAAAPPVPADSGTGRRVVYSNSDQRVWLVDDDGAVVDTYLVSGKAGVPEPGAYEVFSRSEVAYAGHDDITMRYMVRFAHGENLAIGFHSIPNDANGAPLQSEEELGEYHSAGCVRQSVKHAAFLYEWASEGTPVVVLA